MALKKARPRPSDTGQPPAPVGHNEPPAPDSLEAFRARYTELRAAAEKWQTFTITNQAESDDLSAFVKQLKAFAKDADTARKNEQSPHDKKVAEIREKWKPVPLAAERIVDLLNPKLTAWLQAERDRIAAARAAADAKAAEAAEDARKAAEAAAKRPGSLAAADAAEEAAAAQERAEKHARAIEGQRAKSGGHVSVAGVKRATHLKTYRTVRIDDPIAAVKFLVEVDGLASLFVEAAGSAARAYRAAHPYTLIPGVSIIEEERAT